MKTALLKLPTGYDVAYKSTMERVHSQDKQRAELAKDVLSWIVHAQRPLSITELQEALAVEVGESKFDPSNITEDDDIISVCAGLVTIDKESKVVRLVHHTAQEYLVHTHQQLIPDFNRKISTICLTYLGFDVFTSGPCLSDKEYKERLELYEFYKYVCCYWGYHVQAAFSTSDLEVMKFLKKKANLEAASQALQVEAFWRINGIDEYASNVTGLHLIAYFGIDNVMEDLIDNEGSYSKNVDPKTSLGETPLVWAVLNSQEAAVRLLLEKGANVVAKIHRKMYEFEETILHHAIDYRDLEIAKILIENNADTNEETNGNGGCLLFTAMDNNDEEAVELLIDGGCNLEQNEWGEESPLCYAVEREMESMVKLLLRKGANIDALQMYTGSTPLINTILRPNLAMAQVLLENGANTETRNTGRGMELTPLLWVMDRLFEAGWNLQPSGYYEDLAKLLLQHKADTEAKHNISGRTSLSFAAQRGSVVMVELLLRHGADILSSDNEGYFPFHYAVLNERLEVVSLILERIHAMEGDEGEEARIRETRIIEMLQSDKGQEQLLNGIIVWL
jgi:ankyrin repeat protein